MRQLSKFLLAEEPLFTQALESLEAEARHPHVPEKLTREIHDLAWTHLTELGLHESSGRETIYDTLINRIKHDDARFARQLGASDPTDLAELTPLILKRLAEIDMPKSGLFLKLGVAKAMLRHQPPPAIMNRLGYDTVDELLTQEDVREIYGALRFAESPEWLNNFIELYRDLDITQFEVRDIVVLPFNAKKWGDIAEKFIHKKLHNITNLKELGVIVVMPVTSFKMPGIALKVTPLILHYFNEIHLYSAFFKLIGHRPDFGQVLVETLIADTPPNIHLKTGRSVHWRVIQRYFGKLPHEHHPEIFQPHLQPEDLHWRKAESYLFQIDPELSFWDGLDYVGIEQGGETIALNLMDVALSYSNGLKFRDRYLYHFRESLWNEIFIRYFGQPEMENEILRHLDNEIIKPEKLEI